MTDTDLTAVISFALVVLMLVLFAGSYLQA